MFQSLKDPRISSFWTTVFKPHRHRRFGYDQQVGQVGNSQAYDLHITCHFLSCYDLQVIMYKDKQISILWIGKLVFQSDFKELQFMNLDSSWCTVSQLAKMIERCDSEWYMYLLTFIPNSLHKGKWHVCGLLTGLTCLPCPNCLIGYNKNSGPFKNCYTQCLNRYILTNLGL